jgi:hypothetical protein
MHVVYPSSDTVRTGIGRPFVIALFVASCLLDCVVLYKQQGMVLYPSPWFTLAALGVQASSSWLPG